MAIQEDRAEMMWTELLGAVGTTHLPGDLMLEILGRLPVESILRFKSVCRTWYILFRNPMFIHHHTRMANSSAQMTNLFSLLVHTRSYEGNDHILSLLLDHPCGNPIVKNLNFPFKDNFVHIQVVGSINGLVCLNFCSDATSIVLWNPAIREHSQIPNPQLSLESNERVSVGFAYDQKTEIYKVIRILYSKQFTPKMRPARVEIYSTRTNTWRMTEIVGFPWLFYHKTCSTLVNGVPYWYAFELQEQGSVFRELMTWFDVEAEVFRYHPLPCYHSPSRFRMRLGVMGEHPVVIVYSVDFQPGGRVEIWMLNKSCDGGRNLLCWMKKLTIEPVYGVERVVGCGRNGEIIVEHQNRTLFIYDPHPKQIRDLPCYGSWGFVEVYGYIESLVSPSRLS